MITKGGRFMIHTQYCSQRHCDFHISSRVVLHTAFIPYNRRLDIVLIVVLSGSASALGQY